MCQIDVREAIYIPSLQNCCGCLRRIELSSLPLQSDIQGNMFTTSPSNKDGLVVMYNFAQSEIKNIGSAAGEVGKVILHLLTANLSHPPLLSAS